MYYMVARESASFTEVERTRPRELKARCGRRLPRPPSSSPRAVLLSVLRGVMSFWTSIAPTLGQILGQVLHETNRNAANAARKTRHNAISQDWTRDPSLIKHNDRIMTRVSDS